MRVDIHVKNIDLSDEIKDYIEKKERTISRLLADEVEDAVMEVRIGKDIDQNKGKIFFADVKITTPNGVYEGFEYEESVKAALDKVKDKVTKEIRRKKSKMRDLARKGRKKIKEVLRRIPWIK